MLRTFPMMLTALVATLVLTADYAPAAPTAWTIDRAHSQVGFSIRHIFAKVPGSFQKFEGAIVYDPDSVSASSVRVTIDAASIYTANERRDDDLRSDQFFDVAKYPTLTFQSTAVAPAGDGKLTVVGTLDMHGVAKPVTLEVDFLGSGPGTREGELRAGFEARATIDRKEFGILWNRALDQGGMLLGDEVAITINVEAVAR